MGCNLYPALFLDLYGWGGGYGHGPAHFLNPPVDIHECGHEAFIACERLLRTVCAAGAPSGRSWRPLAALAFRRDCRKAGDRRVRVAVFVRGNRDSPDASVRAGVVCEVLGLKL